MKIHEEFQDRVEMSDDYGNIGLALSNQGNYDQALDHLKKALAIHEELQNKVRMARDYGNIGLVLSNIQNNKAAIESFSKGLKIVQELEEKTGYHYPLSDTIQDYISQLQKEKDDSKLEQ